MKKFLGITAVCLVVGMFLYVLRDNSKSEPVPAPEVTCKVIKYTTTGKVEEVCSIECDGSLPGRGFANSIPVDCSWFGKEITRQ